MSASTSSGAPFPNSVVVGVQWGDEGKGKVVDLLAPRSRYVVRFQGGNNAGHTLVVEGEKVVLHVLPSGILNEDCVCVVGNGVVVDPVVVVEELDGLEATHGPVAPHRLALSATANVIMPYHRTLDGCREDALGGEMIGTTRKGIGPCYEDKAARRGVRLAELMDPAALRTRLEAVLPEKNRILTEWYGQPALTVEGLMETLTPVIDRLRPYVRDTAGLLHRALEAQEPILFEGAQGTFLDVDHGSYPFVTSSNTVAGGACAGTGVGPRDLHVVIGVVKAYCTRVGAGPFPTELADATGARLRAEGHEFGATTGRPRRCGWLDIPHLKRAIQLSGVGALALTKLDVLRGFGNLQICVGYEGLDEFPASSEDMDAVVPVYEVLEGFDEDIDGVSDWAALPAAAQAFVTRVEELTGVPVVLIGTGPGRESVILRGDLEAALRSASTR